MKPGKPSATTVNVNVSIRDLEGLIMDVADVKAKLAKLAQDVAAQTTVINSAIALLNGLSALIAALKAEILALQQQLASGHIVSDADIQALIDSSNSVDQAVEASKATLAQSVLANTQEP